MLSENGLLQGALLLAVGTLFFLIYSRNAEKEGQIKALGGRCNRLTGWFPFGIDLIYMDVRSAMTHTNMELWQYCFEKYGKGDRTVEATVMGQRIIFTDDPANIQAVLSSQFDDFGKGEPFYNDWYEFLGDSIFTTDGQSWHSSRQLLRPQFSKSRVEDVTIYEKHVQVLYSKIPPDGETVDLAKLFLLYTMDVATDFLFGKSTSSLENPSEKFTVAFSDIQRIQNVIARAGPANAVMPRKSFNRALKVLNEYIEPYIDEALGVTPVDTHGDSYVFLQALAKTTQDRKMLRDQVVAMLLAGRDTTAAALGWLFHELSLNPSIVRRLREEIGRTVGFGDTPTAAHLKSMTLLQSCINETLRLYPPIPFNVRMSLRPTTLPHGKGSQPMGLLKGAAVAFSFVTLHRNPDVYYEPNSFKPERWDNWKPGQWEYLPFNAGPRTCIGLDFARMEIAYTAVRLLQKFEEIECRRGESEAEKVFFRIDIVLHPGGGVKVGLKKAT